MAGIEKRGRQYDQECKPSVPEFYEILENRAKNLRKTSQILEELADGLRRGYLPDEKKEVLNHLQMMGMEVWIKGQL
jgi:hypothetical protein